MVKRHWFCSKFLQNFCLLCFQDAIFILALWSFASGDSFLRTHSRVICIVQSLKSSLNIVRGIKVSLANIFCSFSYDSKVNVKKAIGLIITDKNTATCLRVVFFFYIYLPSLHNYDVISLAWRFMGDVKQLACENNRFSSPFAAGTFSGEERGETDVFAGYKATSNKYFLLLF